MTTKTPGEQSGDLRTLFQENIKMAAPVETPSDDPIIESKPDPEPEPPIEDDGIPKLDEELVDEDDGLDEEPTEPAVSAELEKARKDAENFQKGMRKFQKERDDFKKQLAQQSDKISAIEKAFKRNGIEGLVQHLTGDAESWKQIEERIAERAVRKYNATPEELDQIELEDKYAREKAAREAAERDYQEHIEAIKERESKAHEAELTSKINPTFEKYRLSGKLGDAEQEQELDLFIWKSSLQKLAQYRDEHGIEDHEIPPAVIEQMFQQVSSRFSSLIDRKADAKAQDTLAKKKAEASKQAKARVTKKKAPAKTIEQEAEKYMSNFNIGGFFRDSFGK